MGIRNQMEGLKEKQAKALEGLQQKKESFLKKRTMSDRVAELEEALRMRGEQHRENDTLRMQYQIMQRQN